MLSPREFRQLYMSATNKVEQSGPVDVDRRLAREAHARRRPGRDQVTGLESREGREEADQLRDAEDQLVGVRILHRLTIETQTNPELLGVRDLFLGGDEFAHRTERVR